MIGVLLFSVAFIIAFLVTPAIRYMALKFYVIDKRNKRKIHNKVITKLGGIAIFAAYSITIAAAYLLEYSVLRTEFILLGTMYVGSVIVLILGIYDDVRGTNALIKIVTQVIAASLLIRTGLVVSVIDTPFGSIDLGVFSVPFTILFTVTVTNAINLIDGLDGLASGVVAIVALGLACIGVFVIHDPIVSIMSIAIAGACLGFLRYNFYPAKIFMGDTGSLFLGFLLATIVLKANVMEGVGNMFLLYALLLGVPIFDTCFALIRRISSLKHPFKADKSHVHHWLLKKGYSQVKAVSMLYTATFVLCLIVLIFSFQI